MKLKFWPVMLAVGLFLAITYVACVIAGIAAPSTFQMYRAWEPLLPGFIWITWGSFFLGLIESFLYGIWTAIIFVPLWNWLSGASNGT